MYPFGLRCAGGLRGRISYMASESYSSDSTKELATSFQSHLFEATGGECLIIGAAPINIFTVEMLEVFSVLSSKPG